MVKRPNRATWPPRPAPNRGFRALLALGLAAGGVFAAGTAQAATTGPGPTSTVLPPTANSSSTVPVLGYTTVTERRAATGVRATALVHGVRRIPGGTVLYYSLGVPAGSRYAPWDQLMPLSQDREYSLFDSSVFGLARLVDLPNKKVYSVLLDSKRLAITSPNGSWPTAEAASGKFYEFYQVVPELPADVTTVDVLIGGFDAVPGVPVTDGALTPAVAQTGPHPLGGGWPQVDEAAVRGADQPEKSIRPLQTESSDIERTVVNREKSGSLTVDLAADVLFAVDKATLGPAARSKVQRAADEINRRAAGGRIQVIGHTDDTGSTAHNQDLSQRRAAAVLAELKPLVTVAGVTFSTAGRGEQDPVASNDTAEGRQQNRRVSVTFDVKEGK